MVIKLYTTRSDAHAVDKALTLIGERDAEIKGAGNTFSPSLVLRDPMGANYCQIMGEPFNGRYYFILPYTGAAHGIATLECRNDVLMNLKSQFLQEIAIIARQESEANLFLNDGQMPIEARKQAFFKEFPSGFLNDFKYYISVGG